MLWESFITGSSELKFAAAALLLIPLLMLPFTEDMFVFPKVSVSMLLISCSLSIFFIRLAFSRNAELTLIRPALTVSALVILISAFSLWIGCGGYQSVQSFSILLSFVIFFTISLSMLRPDSGSIANAWRLIAFVSFIVSLYGWIQTMGFDVFPVEFPKYLQEKRYFSTMGNKNFVSYFLALTLLSYNYFGGRWRMAAALPVLLVLRWFTRGAVLIIVLQALCLVWNKRNDKEYRKLTAAILIVICAGAVILASMRGHVRQLPDTEQKGRYKDSLIQRELIFRSGILMCLKNPLGVGLGNFGNQYFPAQGELIASDERFAQYLCNAGHAHNDFLEVICEMGLFQGIILIGAVLFLCLKAAAGNQYLAPVLAGFAIACCISFPMHLPSTGIFFLFILFIGMRDNTDRISIRIKTFHRFTAFALALFFIFLSLYQVMRISGNIYLRKALQTGNDEFYKRSLSLFPGEERSQFEFGVHLLNTGRVQAAIHYLSAAAKRSLDPSRFYYLGLSYIKAGMGTAARMCFEKTVKLDPYHYHAHFYLARMMEQNGELEAADAEYHMLNRIIKEKLWRM
ncbi:MAG: O-antigen ligase family protein [Candidatus Wallbacteria bacterium]|nr:O-antigen ligase family protein [Candidatus Wallbacteria bacterium]